MTPAADRGPTWRARWRAFAAKHGLELAALELAALALGVAIRLVMLATFVPEASYDFRDHWDHLQWFSHHLSFPDPTYTRTAYHPPLYHFLAGQVARLGGGTKAIQSLSIGFSILRLGLVAVGLRLTVRSARARALALLLAAVLPCAVHLDAMLTQEPLSSLLGTAVVVLVLCMFRAAGEKRWRWAVALGLVAGLELLTKVSAIAIVAMVVLAGPLEAWLTPSSDLQQRLRGLAPWVAAVAIMLAVGGWWYARSTALYGTPFLSGWDLIPTPETQAAHVAGTSMLDRRSLGYLLGWSREVYRNPYYPTGNLPARFWPVFLATAFVDYYMYGFAGGYLALDPGAQAATLERFTPLARASIAAGTLIAAVTVVTWICLVVVLARRRNAGLLTVLLLPLLGLLGQISFAIQFPYDWEGVVKAAYFQFAAAPLWAVFAIGVTWLARRRSGRPLAGLALLALLAVSAYTLACRLT